MRPAEALVYLYAGLQLAAFGAALAALIYLSAEDIISSAKAALVAASAFFASRIVLLALARLD